MTSAYYDIETESLDYSSKLWCLCLAIDNNEPIAYYPDNIQEAFNIMKQADLIWGWNNLSFDSLVLKTQYQVEFPQERDGLILARLIWSQDELTSDDYANKMPADMAGSYSLEAFGRRINFLKMEHKDFTQLSDDMVTYCKNDVALTRKLINGYILRNKDKLSDKAVELEEQTARIIASQRVYGWNINIPKVMNYEKELRAKLETAKTDLRNIFKPKFLADGKIISTKPSKNQKMKIVDIFGKED